MQVKIIAECSILAILSTFIRLPFVIKTYVLSILSGRFTQVLLYNALKLCVALLKLYVRLSGLWTVQQVSGIMNSTMVIDYL